MSTREMPSAAIAVRIGHEAVDVERDVLTKLFDNSVVSDYSAYRAAVTSGYIKFDDLVGLARKAEIPYSLFFAPQKLVDAQLRHKTNTLLRGVSKQVFSMNSRSRVRLSDVELIVKDLLRKQELIKKLDDTLEENEVVGCLRGPRRDVVRDAGLLRSLLGFSAAEIQQCKSRDTALALLIDRFEAQQVLVSMSQQNYMPQRIPPRAKFSGLCVRDKKVPYIFLSTGEDKKTFEPPGRKLFTLVLLGVLVARGKFTAVTYNNHLSTPIRRYEYQVTEEVLMPAIEMRAMDVSSLDAVRGCADTFRVTPSAVVMRARHLGMLDPTVAKVHLAELTQAFDEREVSPTRSPKPVNAIRRYNGAEFSRRMVRQLDASAITPNEFCRVVGLNKLKPHQISEFKMALR